MNANTTTDPKLASLGKAREIIKQNPGASTLQLVAMAWLEGRIALCQELRPEPSSRLVEVDCFCQSCGRRDGSRHVVERDFPADGFFKTRCFHCASGDEPRVA